MKCLALQTGAQIRSTRLAVSFHHPGQSYASHRNLCSAPPDPSTAHGGRIRSAGRPAAARLVCHLRPHRPTARLGRRHGQSPGRGLAHDGSQRAVRWLAAAEPQAYPARGRPEPAPTCLRAGRQTAHAHPRVPLVARAAPRPIAAGPPACRLPAGAGPRRAVHGRADHQR